MALSADLVVCPHCDLVQRVADLPPGGSAACFRCAAPLYLRPGGRSLEICTALMVGALVLLTIAHLFPILGLELQGQRNDARLLDSVLLVHEHGMTLVAALLFLFTLAMPLLQVAGLLAVLVPVQLGRRPRFLPFALRLVQAAAPWSMVEVLILGVLVSLVKLAKLATILPGIALAAFTGFILLMAAASTFFDSRTLWQRLGRRA